MTRPHDDGSERVPDALRAEPPNNERRVQWKSRARHDLCGLAASVEERRKYLHGSLNEYNRLQWGNGMLSLVLRPAVVSAHVSSLPRATLK